MRLNFIHLPVIFGFSIEVYFILLISAIPTIFFRKWLLKKFIRTERTRKLATWLTTILITPVIYAGLVAFLLFGNFTPNKDFDKSEWIKDNEGRFQMAHDIIKSKILIGKDTNQLKQIIGDPSWRENTAQIWTYDMGYGGGSGFDFLFHNLKITFNKKGKVISVEHLEIRD